jgi:ribonuclease HII
MHYLIGTDEAGYGPNLGPLVVAASVWQAPVKVGPAKLYDHLQELIAADCGDDDPRVAIADSKALYSPALGLSALECGVLSCLAAIGERPTSVVALWNALAADSHSQRVALAWHAAEEESLPISACPQRIGQCAKNLLSGFAAVGAKLLSLRAAAIFPGQFNSACEQHENKATVLSLTTLELVKGLLDGLPARPVKITCDKHGGRDYYAGLIQHVFGEEPVRVVRESKAESVYRMTYRERKVEFHFLAKGERMLATALASMSAKYLREVALRPFNRFWQAQVPGLKATAGYPSDSRRFKAEIAVAQTRLGIADQILWRSR